METVTQPITAPADLVERSLVALEFPKIRALLAAQTSFSASRALALEWRPTADLKTAAHRQQETREAIRLRSWKPNISIGNAVDVRRLAHDAEIGRVLEPAELLEIRGTLAAARVFRATILHLKEHLPALWALASQITPNQRLEQEIDRAIGPRGEVLDAASPLLGRIRAEIKIAHDRLLDRLNAIVNSPVGQEALQEPIITLREGRYVLPVKADYKGRLRGIVHDTSASGATLFIEPLATVELNNTWRALQLEETREVQRILRRLSAEVGRFAGPLMTNVNRLADLDLILARARLGERFNGISPRLVTPPEGLVLQQARHPLLQGEVVPIDVEIGRDFRILVITGPNTGGKTVALKTIGLLTLMAAAGLPVPAAAGTQIPVYDYVFADIGDEQSIEQSLSTFSSHMRNIIAVLAVAGPASLVLLDELGAGTDPREGAALARAILEELLRRGVTVVATTHHSELKAFAHLTPGMRNASVEFDEETLAPTYRLVIGTPGRSNALAIAARLGLPAPILEAARAALSPNETAVEELLETLQRERNELSERRAAAAQAEAEQIALREQLAQAVEEALQERERAAEEAREQFLQEVEAIYQQVRRAAARLQDQTATRDALAEALTEVETARREARTKRRAPARSRRTVDRPLIVGQSVLVRSVGQVGTLLTLPDERGEAEVQIGNLRVRARAADLEPASGRQAAPCHAEIAIRRAVDIEPIEMELDLRGRRAEEVASALEQYLNDAYLAGLSSIRVIHGKGTGTLRKIVREALTGHPLVRQVRPGAPTEGGDGVTIAELVVPGR